LKTLIKLLVTVAVLNAAARAGMAAWKYYQLKDAAQQSVIFGGNSPTTQLHNQIVEKAAELGVPLPPENVTVERNGARTIAAAAYREPVELFPRYTYPMEFSFSVEGFNPVAGGTP
jgi:hypothetical protein